MKKAGLPESKIQAQAKPSTSIHLAFTGDKTTCSHAFLGDRCIFCGGRETEVML